MAEKIEFDLRVGANELKKAISDATTGSKKLGDTISTALGVVGGNLATKAFTALGSAIGSTAGFLRDSVRAAQEQENALNRLGQSLRTTGEFSQGAIEDFADFATQLQRTSIFGDEVVLSQIALAKSFGATNDQAKQLVQAAANLSATFGTDINTNVRNLGKTFSGLTGELGELVPELKLLGAEALRSGEGIRFINERFSGAAAADLNTFSGATKSLSNAFGDLQEEIGFFITQSESLGFVINTGKGLIEEITEAIKEYRTEQQRSNGTLVETDVTLTGLTEKYAQVRDEIEKYQQVIDADKQKDLLESLFSFDNAPLARERVQSLSIELAKLQSQIDSAAEKVSQAETTKPKRQDERLSIQELNRIRQFEAQKTLIAEQAEVDRQDFQAQLANVGIENEFAKQEAEIQRILEFETQKRELQFRLAEEKAALIENESLREAELAKIGKERELEFNRIANKAILEEEKIRLKKQQDSIFAFRRYEDQTNKERIQNLQSTLSTIATLSDSGNRTIAAIGKASAISTATIDGFVAVNKALASAPPPINYGLAAAVGAATAANVAKIAGVNFQDGGIVGASNGRDNQLAAIRTGEMVLNAEDQKMLFNAIKSGSLGGGEIVVQIDGREVARAVRNQERSGYSFA